MNAAIKKGRSSLDFAQKLIDYCAQNGIDRALTPMQVLKLTYLCHGWMLGIYGRPMIAEPVEAWQYGPVIPALYQKLKRHGSSVVDCVDGARPIELDPQEQRVLEQVCEIYGRRTGFELSQLTHQRGSPWDTTWVLSGRSGVIPNDLIEHHYRELATSSASARQANAA